MIKDGTEHIYDKNENGNIISKGRKWNKTS